MIFSDEDAKRFWPNVTKHESGCWLWRFNGKKRFAGTFSAGGNVMGAHKFSFLLHGGVLTAEKPWVLHSCNHTYCVNPAHMRAGTRHENYADHSNFCQRQKEWRLMVPRILDNLQDVVSALEAIKER